jgi:hypothetical protein
MISGMGGCALASTPSIPTARHPCRKGECKLANELNLDHDLDFLQSLAICLVSNSPF